MYVLQMRSSAHKGRLSGPWCQRGGAPEVEFIGVLAATKGGDRTELRWLKPGSCNSIHGSWLGDGIRGW